MWYHHVSRWRPAGRCSIHSQIILFYYWCPNEKLITMTMKLKPKWWLSMLFSDILLFSRLWYYSALMMTIPFLILTDINCQWNKYDTITVMMITSSDYIYILETLPLLWWAVVEVSGEFRCCWKEVFCLCSCGSTLFWRDWVLEGEPFLFVPVADLPSHCYIDLIILTFVVSFDGDPTADIHSHGRVLPYSWGCTIDTEGRVILSW